MISRKWNPLTSAQSYQLCPSPGRDAQYAPVPHRGSKSYQRRTQMELVQTNEQNTTSTPSFNHMSSRLPLGKPTVKKRFHALDLLTTSLSFVCLALAVIVVASENISWRLSANNYQLVVLGFLLSIMNLCLGSISPTLFLLLEARFGSSTLQNYDAILRNQPLRSQLSIIWRLVLALTLALPIALSAAYKSFTGGQSVMDVNAATYITNASHYGMFAPPGLQSLGEKTGIGLFSNATLPFAVATAPQNGSDPPLPPSTRAYGFNVLSLNNESTAMLDIPQPNYISGVQALLASGESWNITATVRATVATYNHSKTTNRNEYESFLTQFCKDGQESSGAYTHMSMMNKKAVALLDSASLGDQSLQYIALTEDPGINYEVSCRNFSQDAHLYDLNRQLCEGTWSITRGGIELVDGSCNRTILSTENQLPITFNTLFLGVWYMSSLVELLGPFATARNSSVWESPYMATAMAAMLWSRITVLNSAQNLVDADPLPLRKTAMYKDADQFTFEDIGLLYPVNDHVVYIRPTLRTSFWLYTVLALQPLLTFVMLGLITVFFSTPLDKGFGLISILSGIDTRSLDRLTGASLSGQLAENVKLVIGSVQDDQKGAVEYHVEVLSPTAPRNGRLARNIVYH